MTRACLSITYGIGHVARLRLVGGCEWGAMPEAATRGGRGGDASCGGGNSGGGIAASWSYPRREVRALGLSTTGGGSGVVLWLAVFTLAAGLDVDMDEEEGSLALNSTRRAVARATNKVC
jgi:hypothetical protein